MFIKRSRICLVDVSSVLHSSKHAFGKKNKLSKNDQYTFIMYGFLFRLRSLAMHTRPDVFVFALDSKTSLRKKYYSKYKSNRDTSKKTEEQIHLDNIARPQFEIVQNEIIPKLGYKNIFYAEGYEADDIIARVCKSYPDNEICIVTSDEDMYQLLSERVAIIKPKDFKWYTYESFKNEYEIEPVAWKRVKMYGGCTSDTVPGIPIPNSPKNMKIGKGYALSYIKNTLNPKSKAYQAFVVKENKKLIFRNKVLTSLPFIGTPDFTIQPDIGLSKQALIDMCNKFGFKSILSDLKDFCRTLKLH